MVQLNPITTYYVQINSITEIKVLDWHSMLNFSHIVFSKQEVLRETLLAVAAAARVSRAL